jgi:protein involved in polysaccharide export with SLBB domain
MITMRRALSLIIFVAGWVLGSSPSVAQPAFSTPVPIIPVPTANISAPPTALPANNTLPANIPLGIASLTNGYVPDDSYQLRVGDTVSFQIVEDRILNLQAIPTSLVVMDSGEVDVPYIGRVKAANKTCNQLGAGIKTELEKKYYNKATVVLSLNVANRLLGRVYIWGQVHSQGPVNLMVNEQLTAAKAIMQAGGFAEFAKKKKVQVIRSTSQGTNQTFELNMEDIMDNGDTAKDIILKPDDMIIVPTRMINF